MDALLSAMQSVIGPAASPSDLRQRLEHDITSNSATGASSGTPSHSAGPSPDASAGSALVSDVPPSAPLPFDAASGITPAAAEERLHFFRSEMLPYFPFLSLPSSLTAGQLQKDRPALFHAIVTVTAFSTQRRLPLIESLKQLVFDSALVKAQFNLDVLLGVLTYIAWSTDGFFGRASLLSRLMVLAVSLVYDLRLFKPSRPDVQAIVSYTQGFPEHDPDAPGNLMERQRALLACFVLSSQYAFSVLTSWWSLRLP